jgi:hypothetical protein
MSHGGVCCSWLQRPWLHAVDVTWHAAADFVGDDSSVWSGTLELPHGDYYIVLRDLGGDGWTVDEDVDVSNTPRLILYSEDCNQYVGSYTFGEPPAPILGCFFHARAWLVLSYERSAACGL